MDASKSVSGEKPFFSSLWQNPRSRRGLGLAGLGIVLVFFGGGDLLRDSSNEFARWSIYVGLAVFLPGAILAVATWRREIRAQGLSSSASVRGRVISVKKDWLSQGYVLHYSFNDWMGRTYRGRKILFQKEAFTWRDGEEGEVRYDRNDPRINVWIGSGFEFDEDEKMASVLATVVEVAERNANGENEVVVRYRYRDHLGEIHEDQFVEKQGVPFKQGDTGKVQFNLWHPALNLWLGKSERGKESAGAAKPLRSSSASIETPVFLRAPVPSPFTLFRRCIPMRRALANFVWFLFYALFLLGAINLTADQLSEEALLGLTMASLVVVAFFLFGVVRNWINGVRQLREWRGCATNLWVARANRVHEPPRILPSVRLVGSSAGR